MLAYAEDKIKEAEGRLIVIETSSQPGYEKTRRFYLKHGYEAIARLPDFYAPGDDKIILQKRLKIARRIRIDSEQFLAGLRFHLCASVHRY